MNAAVLTVLVVEDEALIRMALADALTDAGYEVIEAADVAEALLVLGVKADIAALVTDIDMPGTLNGLDLVRLVSEMGRGIEMVVTSGRAGLREQVPSSAACFGKPARYEDIAGHLFGRVSNTARIAA